ncbi:MAG: hypothetical protein WCO52_02310 [bacterium]
MDSTKIGPLARELALILQGAGTSKERIRLRNEALSLHFHARVTNWDDDNISYAEPPDGVENDNLAAHKWFSGIYGAAIQAVGSLEAETEAIEAYLTRPPQLSAA